LTDANNCFTNQIAGSVKMTENTFVLSNGGRIKIGEEAWETMGAGVQTDEKARESGGVMMGRFIKDCKDLVIDKVTQPMDGDRQSRYGFKRLSPLHQEILDKEWMASKGTCNYLGEWHTHQVSISMIGNENYARTCSQVDISIFLLSEQRRWAFGKEIEEHSRSIN